MSEGKYIVIEGHDGTGKSTQVGRIRDQLAENDIESIEFHEPEGAPIADAIRTIIKNGSLERDGLTNLLLFNAARREIWRQKALPALQKQIWVVAARNYFSTLAYQGYGEGLSHDLIIEQTRLATDERYMHPDHAVVLQLNNHAERTKRIASRGALDVNDTFESKNDDFQLRVEDGYLQIAHDFGVAIIDASQPVEVVSEQIWQRLDLS